MVPLIVLLLKEANDNFYRVACKRKPINNDITVIKLIKKERMKLFKSAFADLMFLPFNHKGECFQP